MRLPSSRAPPKRKVSQSWRVWRPRKGQTGPGGNDDDDDPLAPRPGSGGGGSRRSPLAGQELPVPRGRVLVGLAAEGRRREFPSCGRRLRGVAAGHGWIYLRRRLLARGLLLAGPRETPPFRGARPASSRRPQNAAAAGLLSPPPRRTSWLGSSSQEIGGGCRLLEGGVWWCVLGGQQGKLPLLGGWKGRIGVRPGGNQSPVLKQSLLCLMATFPVAMKFFMVFWNYRSVIKCHILFHFIQG